MAPRQRLVGLPVPGHGRTLSEAEVKVLADVQAAGGMITVGAATGWREVLGEAGRPMELVLAIAELEYLGLVRVRRFEPQDPELARREWGLILLLEVGG